MADYSVLGLFHEAESTADAIDRLHKMGIADDQITIMSGMPYKPEMLGRPSIKRRVGWIALIGAALGLLAGAFLSVGIFLLYPLDQGGQPVVPVPPTFIVLFEATMLGTMWAAFFGLLGENRFPVFKSEIYDPRITEGHIGVAVHVGANQADLVEQILKDNGAHHVRLEMEAGGTDWRLTGFWAGAALVVVALGALILLVAYDVLEISFPTNMAHQESIAYLEGPRKAAPEGAVPIQGPVLIAGEPASRPLPATGDSLQRGAVLFRLNCVMCHGEQGNGSGMLAGFFTPAPADLTGEDVQEMAPQEIFLVITEGRGVMPAIYENLSASERWDVVNHVQSLGK